MWKLRPAIGLRGGKRVNRLQSLRDRLFNEQKGRCFYCRCHMVAAGADDDRATTLDHVAAKSRGGKLKNGNAVAACRKCNQDKADAPVANYLKKSRPGRPLHKRVLPTRDDEIAKARVVRKMRERRRLGGTIVPALLSRLRK